jgi:formylglycine-generating enzyme
MRHASRDLGVVVAVFAMVGIACSAPQMNERSLKTQPQAIAVNAGPGMAIASGLKEARTSETSKETLATEESRRCPKGMALIDGRYCIDRFEASLVDVLTSGEERPHSPFQLVDGQIGVRAVSEPNVYPQGYISAAQAQRACAASGKRLCKIAEWQEACRGPEKHAFGYSDAREPGRCNDNGKNPVRALYGANYSSWTMNQPALNQLEGTLAKTGAHEGCTNGYGVYDMVGNLHEWVADPNGTFFGGYYQDVTSQGHGGGCSYITTAHSARYHDYSTGFRCCADVPGQKTDEVKSSPKTTPPRTKTRKRR